MQDLGYVSPCHRLLVSVCRRDAEDGLDRKLVKRLDDATFVESLLDLASRHRVLGLTLSVLARTRDTADGKRFGDPLRSARRRAALFEIKRDRVVKALADAGVRHAILKGAGIAVTIYDDPVERDLADLDVLIGADDLEAALRALEHEGYIAPSVAWQDAYRRHHFHIPLHHPDQHIAEIHWALTRAGEPFQLDPAEIFERATAVEWPGVPVSLLPCPEHTLLHLVVQNLQEAFSRLARLVDMDRILLAQPDLDWDLLVETARKGNLAAPTAMSLRLASRLLGTEVPEDVLAELRPGALARFHLAIMHPVHSLLTQSLERTHSARRLHGLWLVGSLRQRLILLRGMLEPEVFFGVHKQEPAGPLLRFLRLGKLVALQALQYAGAIVDRMRGAGRAEMHFW